MENEKDQALGQGKEDYCIDPPVLDHDSNPVIPTVNPFCSDAKGIFHFTDNGK